MVCEPAYNPAAYPRSRPASFAQSTGESRQRTRTTSEKPICRGPSLVRPLTNCGPTPYPTAKMNRMKKVDLTLGEMAIPS